MQRGDLFVDACIVLKSLVEVAVVIQSEGPILLDSRNRQSSVEVRLYKVISRAFSSVTETTGLPGVFLSLIGSLASVVIKGAFFLG